MILNLNDRFCGYTDIIYIIYYIYILYIYIYIYIPCSDTPMFSLQFLEVNRNVPTILCQVSGAKTIDEIGSTEVLTWKRGIEWSPGFHGKIFQISGGTEKPRKCLPSSGLEKGFLVSPFRTSRINLHDPKTLIGKRNIEKHVRNIWKPTDRCVFKWSMNCTSLSWHALKIWNNQISITVPGSFCRGPCPGHSNLVGCSLEITAAVYGWSKMRVSINGGTPIAEWFVVVDNPIEVDDLGILCCNCNKLQKTQVSSASGKHPLCL